MEATYSRDPKCHTHGSQVREANADFFPCQMSQQEGHRDQGPLRKTRYLGRRHHGLLLQPPIKCHHHGANAFILRTSLRRLKPYPTRGLILRLVVRGILRKHYSLLTRNPLPTLSAETRLYVLVKVVNRDHLDISRFHWIR